MQNILVLFPFTAYLLLTLSFLRAPEGIVRAHLFIFGFIAITTEILSAFRYLNFTGIVVTWILFLGAIYFWGFKNRFKTFLWPTFRDFDFSSKWVLFCIAAVLAFTFFTAIAFPPNNWDSMTYHMPRVIHWIKNQSVSFYPTAILRQNYQMPLAEFAILHLQVLTGGDHFANLVQWINFVVLIALAKLIAEEFALPAKYSWLSAFFVATLPMGILQASSTQNDLVVGCFLMAFSLFLLRLKTDFRIANLFFSGVSLGLAFLTKGTAFIYATPLGLALGCSILFKKPLARHEILKRIAKFTVIILMALSICLGHFSRSYQLYGKPIAAGEESSIYLATEYSSVKAVASGIFRNTFIHFGTPFQKVSEFQKKLGYWVFGEEINSPKTTLTGTSFAVPFYRSELLHEDLAGNLLHVVLALLGVVLLIRHSNRKSGSRFGFYVAGIILGGVFFSVAIKWQPWATRLHTPLFVMFAPILSMIVYRISAVQRLKRFYSFIVVLFFSYSLPFLLMNSTRSILSLDWLKTSREQLYFKNQPNLYEEYKSVVSYLNDERQTEVGLLIGGSDSEYLFWAIARGLQFRFIDVSNSSKALVRDHDDFKFVIATQSFSRLEHELGYQPVLRLTSTAVFKKSSF